MRQSEQVLHLGPGDGARYLLPFRPRQLPALGWPLVIVGAGAAGAAAALAAAGAGREVLVLRKPPPSESNTRVAQGGIAAAVGAQDSVEEHARDTIAVGCGLADPLVVKFIIGQGPEVAAWLEALGVRFDQRERSLELGREGGHAKSRVLSSGGDSTGREIQGRLDAALEADPRITVRDDLRAVDLLVAGNRCVGLIAVDPHGQLLTVNAGACVLATGAVGQIFRETTNPAVATGDGIAMGFRAGVELQDLEFVQFHPTTLYIAGAARVLISEAVRGAGAKLVDRDRQLVMAGRHPSGDLAPRDVVSRAILDCMVETGDTHVYLDASGVPNVVDSFPRIASTCAAFGIDIAKDPIPVRPGAHYMIGGIRTDLEARTSLEGLFACGEVAATGLHGANRLASNSLLEAIVLGRVAGSNAAEVASYPDASALGSLDDDPTASDCPGATAEAILNLDDMLYSLKSLMWRQVGLLRERFALDDAQDKIRFWQRVLLSRPAPAAKFVDIANMLAVGRLVCLAAHSREESRGTHYRSDFPDTDEAQARHLVLRRASE